MKSCCCSIFDRMRGFVVVCMDNVGDELFFREVFFFCFNFCFVLFFWSGRFCLFDVVRGVLLSVLFLRICICNWRNLMYLIVLFNMVVVFILLFLGISFFRILIFLLIFFFLCFVVMFWGFIEVVVGLLLYNLFFFGRFGSWE